MTQEQISDYLAQHPDADPSQNEHLQTLLHAPDYQDRGLHGPLGGKNGARSQAWIDDYERAMSGGTSEFGLMTVVAPAGAQEDVQNQ